MLAPGDTFDRYRIDALLGRGGMGAVFRAYDERLRRPVALKVLERRVGDDARVLLLREARIAAGLNHPNIVMVYDVGEARGVTFMAMELVEGDTLKKLAAGRPPAPTQVLKWMLDVARGLDEAHRAGLMHRDIKPANVIVTPSGAKILDFGIAKPTDDARDRYTAPLPALATTPGHSAGTPRYMAPERIVAAAPIDARADQFAWGLVAYELLSGKPGRPDQWDPYDPWRVPSMAGLAAPVADILTRALAASPAERFASMADVVRALEPLAGSREATLEFRAMPTPGASSPPDTGGPRNAKESFREPDRALLEPLARASLADLKRRIADRCDAMVIVTVDVMGGKARFFVQVVAIDGSGQLRAIPSSVDALRAAGNLIGADARAGNGRWKKLVFRLEESGVVPFSIELS